MIGTIGKTAGQAGALRLRARRFARDEQGAAAVVLALVLVLLVPATLGLIDVYMITAQRSQLQNALDTATLYAARSDKTAPADIQQVGDDALRANLELGPDQRITYTSFKLDGVKVVSEATITPPSIGPRIWKQNDLQAKSEVLRNSNNVEVALVLDTTGSMSAQMGALRTAAKDLVDLVVKDQQPPEAPYYTKVAIVPYSYGVNMGGYEASIRAAVRGATAISGATQTNPVVVTSTAHGLREGERVRITGVNGMTQLNDQVFIASGVTADSFKLKYWDRGSAYWLNGSGYGKYKSGGTAQCEGEGCQTHTFTSASNKQQSFSKTTCATERIGTEAYTDAGPGGAPIGWHYGSCPSASIMPLSSNKTALKNHISSLDDAGSTAGHIGLAWGWYMVSPAWSSVWTGDSAPAAYDKPHLLKVVVLMTDGAFNTPYCKGVAAKDSGSGAPGSDNRINCNATNGDPFAQAETLCRNIRDKGVIIYTVGFNVGSDPDVKNLMQTCATSPEYVYMPSNGADLKIAFRAIAQDINSLRISK